MHHAQIIHLNKKSPLRVKGDWLLEARSCHVSETHGAGACVCPTAGLTAANTDFHRIDHGCDFIQHEFWHRLANRRGGLPDGWVFCLRTFRQRFQQGDPVPCLVFGCARWLHASILITRMGFRFNAVPRNRCAPPIRPPRCKNSRCLHSEINAGMCT